VTSPTFLASFDIEDWFHAENIRPTLGTTDWTALEARVERNTHALLDVLGEVGVTSTFFVLGWVARRYPELVRRIADEGHEVASHTDLHRQLWSLSPAELATELTRSRESLEQVTGTRVLGVRAPNFSISDAVIDAMADAGYWYDSSFFSVRAHGRYGRLSRDVDPEQAVVEIRPGMLELPMSRVRVGRAALPWAGGAYFRLIPYQVFRGGVAARLRRRSWFMFYLHPWELDPDEAPPAGLPYARRLRSYVGRRRMRRDLHRLLAEFGSRRIDETLRSLGFAAPAGPDQHVPSDTQGSSTRR
jgi:polysaccharide deacetylase family protein (PEP-CTERM system associated)